MKNELSGLKIAVLSEDGFEQSELEEPVEALQKAGADVFIISPRENAIKGWWHGEWKDEIKVDVKLEDAHAKDYDGLLLPGGVLNPDKLRRNPNAVDFVKHFFESNKPVAAICHGPQMLIDADVLEGRKITSFFSIRKDMENAGAEWVNEEVVVDGNLVTSRKPADLPAFNRSFIQLLGRLVLK